jgi:hypothetical protein
MMCSFDLSTKAHVSDNIMMELNQMRPPKTLKQWRKGCFIFIHFLLFSNQVNLYLCAICFIIICFIKLYSVGQRWHARPSRKTLSFLSDLEQEGGWVSRSKFGSGHWHSELYRHGQDPGWSERRMYWFWGKCPNIIFKKNKQKIVFF